MDTKEAIEFLEGYLHPCGIMEDDDYRRKCRIKLENILDEVLPRGEKYKKMWGENKIILQALKEKAEKNLEIDELRSFSNAYINTEVIEQKYFPKGGEINESIFRQNGFR